EKTIMAYETKSPVTTMTAGVVAETAENGNLVIVREAICDKRGNQLKTQDGRAYFAYILKGKLRGRDIKVDFSPKDKGGYVPLDLVFDVSAKAELLISEVVTEMNGIKQRRTIYEVCTVDEGEQLWKCEIKPTRKSDGDLLAMILNMLGKVPTSDETAAA
ncbi:MAG: hypothetical protein K2N47_03160, partial [Clostridia bacterium]|nr:hypothetical protein [Clostridia bacterium]